MSVDPSAIVVAVTAATGALIQGADVPAQIRDPAMAALEVAEQSAPVFDQQVDSFINQLPAPLQDRAQQAVDTTTRSIADAVDPYLPREPERPDVQTASPPPELRNIPEQAGGTSAPGSDTTYDSDEVQGFASEVLLPPIPAALPAVSLTPVGSVAVFVPWLMKAGQICDGVRPPILAALYAAENGFRYGPSSPVSPSGARGPGQFMPATWASYGKDADGDGKIDVNSVADAVMASGDLLCDIYGQVEAWKREGVVRGDTLDLTLAGYNAGAGAVRRSGGMPSGLADYENQTKPYVAKIRATEAYFAKMLSPFGGLPIGDQNSDIVNRAMRYLGLPYVWGGGGIDGPSGGGFDCSGLTSFAVFAATGVKLPRTSETQWQIGTEVPWEQARPGDLLFGNWQAGGPGHVAIYVGEGQMIHAPTTGDVVRVGPVFPDMKARRIL